MLFFRILNFKKPDLAACVDVHFCLNPTGKDLDPGVTMVKVCF